MAEPDPTNKSDPDKARGEAAPPTETKKPQQLTQEEQMALYEDDLKENDWGHQPC